jgi:hypothetical protein
MYRSGCPAREKCALARDTAEHAVSSMGHADRLRMIYLDAFAEIEKAKHFLVDAKVRCRVVFLFLCLSISSHKDWPAACNAVEHTPSIPKSAREDLARCGGCAARSQPEAFLRRASTLCPLLFYN